MNITNITITNMQDLISAIDQEVYNSFAVVLLIAFAFLALINLSKRYKFTVALFYSLALQLPLVVVFMLLSLLSGAVLVVYLLLLGASAALAWVM